MKFKSNTNCCVPQCKSYHSKNPELSFHYFPKSVSMKREWVRVLRLGKKQGRCARVCSRHFKSSNYKKPGTACSRLVDGAVPDRNLPVSASIPLISEALGNQRRERKQRALKRKQDESCDQASESKLNADSSGSSLEKDVEPGLMEAPQSEPSEEPAAAAPSGSGATQDPDIIFTESVGVQVNSLLDEALKGPNFMDLFTSDQDMRILTGLETCRMFRGIVECCKRRRNSAIDVERNVIMTMMKLKHDLSYSFLSIVFRLSVPTIASIFTSTLSLLSACLSAVLYWPSVDEVRENMPKCFQKFQKTRVVLDCTEFPVESAKCLRCRILTYSNYKGQNTCKVMLGVSPAGLITFVSVPWGGKASDKEVFCNSSLLDSLEPYVDAVMVDKGFHIELELEQRAVELYRPPFLRNKKQLSKLESQATAEIAAARVHVERVIGRLKIFKILNAKISWSLLPHMQNILTVLCGVTNLSRPVLSSERFL